MRINYSVKRRIPVHRARRRIEHKNGKLDLDVPDAEWGEEQTHARILEQIALRNPGWMITGYVLIHSEDLKRQAGLLARMKVRRCVRAHYAL